MSEEQKNKASKLNDTDTVKIDAAAVDSILKEAHAGEVQQIPEDTMNAHMPSQDDNMLDYERMGTHTAKNNKQKKKMTDKQKKCIIGGAIAAAVVLVCVAGGLTRQFLNRVDESRIAYAEYGTVENSIAGEGYTAARDRQEIGQDIRGTITGVLVEVGDVVAEGDILFEIDPTDMQKELKTAQEELKTLQANLNAAKSSYSSAQSNANAVRNVDTQKSLTAPFTGKVILAEGGASFKAGQFINAGTVVGTMVDDTTMKLPVYFNIAYKDVIKVGQTANISIPSNMSTLQGTVASIENTDASGDGVSSFRAVITLPNAGALTKGIPATATVSTGTEEVYPIDSGALQYNREETLTAPLSGEIKAVNGLDNTTYSNGSVIMKIGTTTVNSDSGIAQSAVTSAQSMVTSAQRLVTEKERTIAQLQKVIKDAKIVAPIAGTVVNLEGREGQAMNGEIVAVVANVDEVVVNANVPATQVQDIEVGQITVVTMQLNDRTIEVYGSIMSVALESDKKLGVGATGEPMFPVVMELYSLDETLRADYPVKYKIILEEATDTLIVPAQAIVQTEEGPAVFAKPLVVDGAEVPYSDAMIIPSSVSVPKGYYLVPVQAGITDGVHTQILWGIEEGAQVYLSDVTEIVNEPLEIGGEDSNIDVTDDTQYTDKDYNRQDDPLFEDETNDNEYDSPKVYG